MLEEYLKNSEDIIKLMGYNPNPTLSELLVNFKERIATRGVSRLDIIALKSEPLFSKYVTKLNSNDYQDSPSMLDRITVEVIIDDILLLETNKN